MTGNQEAYKQSMALGHNAAWDLDWKKAIGLYSQALTELPEDPKALTAIGLAYTELQNYTEAIDYYNRAAKASSGDPVIIERIARLYERIGDLNNATLSSIEAGDQFLKINDISKAIENWSQVTTFNPEDLASRTRLANLLERIGRKDEAGREYLELAALIQHGGDGQSAKKVIEHAIELAPNDMAIQNALSAIQSGQVMEKPARRQGGTGPIMMAQVRQFDQNFVPSRTGRAVDPITETKQNALIALAGFLFNQQSAAQATTPARRDTPKPNDTAALGKISLHLTQAIDAQTHDQIPQAIYELSAATSKGLNHPAANFNLGFLYYQNGEYDKAMKFLQKSQASPDYALGSKLLIGRILKKANKLNGAARVYMEAMAVADTTTVPASEFDNLMAQYEPIIDSFDRDADSGDRQTVCDNVEAQLIRTDWRQHLRGIREEIMGSQEGFATPIISVLLQTKSTGLIQAMSTIREYNEKNKNREALETAFFALDESPNFLPLHQMIADLLYKLHEKQAAVQKYKIIAKTYTSRGENARAVQLLRHAVAMMPMDMDMRKLLIDNLNLMGLTEDVIREQLQIADIYLQLAEFEHASQICQDTLQYCQRNKGTPRQEAEVLRRIADLDTQRLDWKQALHDYERVKNILPDDAKVRKARVDIFFHLGQTSSAVEEVKEFLAILNNMGQSSRGTSFLQQLIREYPDKPALRALQTGSLDENDGKSESITALDALGEELMTKGDIPGAIAVIEQILLMQPPNASDYRNLLDQLKRTIGNSPE